MKLGLFMMPLHTPSRNLTENFAADRDAVILGTKLDVVVIWCGAHVYSIAEPIASSLIFFASAIAQTKDFIFSSGVINLPQQHPSHVAGRIHHGNWDRWLNKRF